MNGFESFLDRVAAAQWGLAPLVLVALAGLSLLRARPATRVALAAILAGASLFAVAVPPLGDPGRAIEAVRRDLAATTGSVVDRAPIPKTPEPESSVAASPSSVPSRPTASTEGRAVPRPPTWLWLVVTSWLFARSAWAFVAARSRLRRLRPAPAAWLSEVRAAARALDVTVPRVAITRERASPAVFVAGRPVLVLPEGLLAGLDRTARRALLLHELAHLKRGDATWRGVVGLACALAWWNPLLWWLRSVVRSRAEDACDAWVARKAPESRESYARLLLDAERFAAGFRVRVRPAPAAIPMSSVGARRLGQRIARVLGEPARPRASGPGLAATVAVAAIAIATASLAVQLVAAPAAALRTPGTGFDDAWARGNRIGHREVVGRFLIRLEGASDPARIPSLVGALRDAPRTEDRRRAADALGNLFEAATPAIPALLRALADDASSSVRREAADAIGRIGAHTAPRVEAALARSAASDPSAHVRREVADVLARFERAGR